MSQVMEEEIKRWTARRKSALVLEIIQGKTTVAEASRQFDLTPSEIESWVEDGKRGMENALRAKPEDVREQYERPLKELPAASGAAMLELRARHKLASLLGKDPTCWSRSSKICARRGSGYPWPSCAPGQSNRASGSAPFG